MRTIRASAYLIFFLLMMVMAQSTRAQGVIVPGPCERCPRPPRPVQLPPALPVKSIKIETKINAQVATTHVEQIFRNDTDATLEGTYFFPVPEAASISEFAIWDGDRRLVGEVRSREEARRIYDEIVRRKRDPGLLEYAGKDLFQASIFPIPPHSDKKLELTYTQVLRAESGTVSYRYPLGTGHNTQQIGAISARVELESSDPLRNIYSPSHAIDVARRGDSRAVVSFETTGGQTPQDFQLFYGLSKDDFGVSLLTYREPGKDGYFLLLVSPKNELSEQEYAAKDILFVLDTSGSMADQGKMEKARAALLFGIKSLRSEDRFNVISFAGEERLMERGLIAADDAGRARGLEYVNALRPTGGTNINDSLMAAIRQFSQSERPRIIVFMTDGLPTVSETNPQRIIENVARARVPGVRLFTFGVGYDVNTALLDKLAADNGGVAEYIEPREDIEIKVSSFFAKINYPVLTDLKLEMGGVETDLVYPRNLPDLFKGTQIALIGRYRNPVDLGHVRLGLTGRTGSRAQTFFYDNQRFPLKAEKNDFLPRLWATRRVGWLMEQIRTNGEQRELRDEVVDLGTRYGIVTPYTSYLALESDEATQVTAGNRDADGRRSGNRQQLGGTAPSATPSGTITMAERAPIPKDAVRAKTGAVAVQQSKRDRAQQESTRVEAESSTAGMRSVGGKTFYLREGVWVDAEFKADARLPETALVFAGDEYFALLKREPRLADFFALGERVVVVYQGRVYRVTAAAAAK
ncbi:MAG TPA: VIT and VWA domain-containing protein [Pyrinomonadaceae bacterium]|nr:VIT and VWA domain-containing protein [Pyrinomonadaceae bacterium]